MEKNRYLAPVAWRKVCKPYEGGGLGVKDLKMFGEALFMKLVWEMMGESDKMWIKVCRAKYCPQIRFWDAKSYSSSSAIWRNIMKLKGEFKSNVRWIIGDGNKIKAVAQPWFSGWDIPEQRTMAVRKKVVADMFDFDVGQWKEEDLNEVFNPVQVRSITQVQPKPTRQAICRDRLIWMHSKSGIYSVKEGYRYLLQRTRDLTIDARAILWRKLQKWKGIVHKVKVFLWRLISGGLMLAQNLHRRINRISPMCQRCSIENEYEMYCFFFCQGSRAVWFGSRVGLRTHDLPLNIVEALQYCAAVLKENDIQEFSYTLWEIWKGRNEAVMQNKRFDVHQIRKKIEGWLNAEIREDNVIEQQIGIVNSNRSLALGRHEYHETKSQIIVDGSWDSQQNAGCANIWYQGGRIKEVQYNYHILSNPFHPELMAVKEAVSKLQRKGVQKAQIFCDNSNLVHILTEERWDELPNLRAMQDAMEVFNTLRQWGGAVVMKHVAREVVWEAHTLANEARRNKINYDGVPRNWSATEGRLEGMMNDRFFQRVQENPP
ncbi:RNA-directed DNA polymerase (reverse transcriptase)-related family protein [Rhynchospora pubera]|uniref:RNA-directed DNA polymerase (Reverse transcriptase)-related family protein n=1 Tax=Rhynchospora pubera TaxID=906938 RepID=A0AAV8E526_9POAL|nr:RNA-directed DNA polymerase (reverse transcriptase)-related family protein [Rhynchospora pubera]